ncbi:Peroxidase 57 precursor, putative [Ricinus communis]|uniref:Peroxidase n=1 Tax=Ricinus communis TaxID=3988 RepID=B9RI07_RICCO|nr:Peroxidase 57 precursor, putative [Ricinus communis]
MADFIIKRRRFFAVMLIIPVLLSLRNPKVDQMEDINFSVFLQRDEIIRTYSTADIHDLEYDFYRQTCPQAESIVRSRMASIYSQHNDVSAGLLRLFFHDCFIKGCDASVFLDDSNGNSNRSIEKQAIPNRTLKGLDKIDMIKKDLENACPGVVSCADTLALATRDGVVLAGGPFYPVFTGRRDSTQSYFQEAMAEIPKPNGNISETLDLFALRGFNERETVSLLGAHNVGRIGCDFIQGRLDNFEGTGQPDPSMPSDFVNEMRLNCQDNSSIVHDEAPVPMMSREVKNPTNGLMFSQGLSTSVSSGTGFDAHYYRNLLRGRGLLFSDQQLMADENTARYVRLYSSDDGITFRKDFSRAMVRMSNLNVLTGIQGEVRTKCSLPVSSSS